MFSDETKITGAVELVLRSKSGRVKRRLKIKNLVVTTGKVFIAASMAKTTVNTPVAMTHMAVGTTNTAPAAGDTTLAAEVAASRTALTSTTPSSNTCVYVCTFGAGVGTGALVEAGIFNASSAGTMLCRSVFSVINKGVSDSLTITWTITVN
jgi:hypothetical protein